MSYQYSKVQVFRQPRSSRTNPYQYQRSDCDAEISNSLNSLSIGKTKVRYTRDYKNNKDELSKSKDLHGRGWWKIVVYNADKFCKDDFFSMLDNTTNESIDPQQAHVNKDKLVFWIKNTRAKDAIKHQSGKLTIKDHTIHLFTVMSSGPEIILSKDDHKAKLCNALIKRYCENKLDLSLFHHDEDLKGTRSRLYEISAILGELIEEKCADLIHEIDFSSNNLNSTRCLRQTITACNRNLVCIKFDNNFIKMVPELKPLSLYAPNITHLSLINNPIKNIMDEAQYITDIRKMFPKLEQLDNLPLPEKIKFDGEQTVTTLPETKKQAILLKQTHKTAVEHFLSMYIKIHDSEPESRSQLACVYNDECLFSCATYWKAKGKPITDKFPCKMPSDLYNRNRNFKLCCAAVKESRLFCGRENVIRELCGLEETKHMLQTLNIYTSPELNNHVVTALSGVIDTPTDYRTFSRTFVLEVDPVNGITILNDQLSVLRTTPDTFNSIEVGHRDELLSRMKKTTKMSINDCKQCLEFSGWDFEKAMTNFKLDLVKRVQEATKMKTEYCTQCLEASDWNFGKAMSNFKDKYSKGLVAADFLINR